MMFSLALETPICCRSLCRFGNRAARLHLSLAATGACSASSASSSEASISDSSRAPQIPFSALSAWDSIRKNDFLLRLVNGEKEVKRPKALFNVSVLEKYPPTDFGFSNFAAGLTARLAAVPERFQMHNVRAGVLVALNGFLTALKEEDVDTLDQCCEPLLSSRIRAAFTQLKSSKCKLSLEVDKHPLIDPIIKMQLLVGVKRGLSSTVFLQLPFADAEGGVVWFSQRAVRRKKLSPGYFSDVLWREKLVLRVDAWIPLRHRIQILSDIGERVLVSERASEVDEETEGAVVTTCSSSNNNNNRASSPIVGEEDSDSDEDDDDGEAKETAPAADASCAYPKGKMMQHVESWHHFRFESYVHPQKTVSRSGNVSEARKKKEFSLGLNIVRAIQACRAGGTRELDPWVLTDFNEVLEGNLPHPPCCGIDVESQKK